MKLTIAAVGRLRAGPEAALLGDYLDRAGRTGRQLGLGPVRVIEIDERKAAAADRQADRLVNAIPEDAEAMALDERGEALTSAAFASLLADRRDAGVGELAFLIGGADGHGSAARERAGRLLSLGPMTWPHVLARVMLAEQIYRACSILAGKPYHRA